MQVSLSKKEMDKVRVSELGTVAYKLFIIGLCFGL